MNIFFRLKALGKAKTKEIKNNLENPRKHTHIHAN